MDAGEIFCGAHKGIFYHCKNMASNFPDSITFDRKKILSYIETIDRLDDYFTLRQQPVLQWHGRCYSNHADTSKIKRLQKAREKEAEAITGRASLNLDKEDSRPTQDLLLCQLIGIYVYSVKPTRKYDIK
jgi:hypothetical protein